MKSLLVIASAPASLVGGKPRLDKKFVEGMTFYSDQWNGPVSCLLKQRDDAFPFGQVYDPKQLPFDVKLIPDNHDVGAEDIADTDVILCSGDDHECLHLADLTQNRNQNLIYIIENVVGTRRQIIFLDRSRSLPKKIYSLLWMLNQERRRRRAFRLADGIQANGYPAFETYGPLNSNTMMYLDSRIGEGLLATAAEMEARRKRILSGAPLRLIHSGRLEPLKGSQDLVPIARLLASRGIDFELNIFGSGSLEIEIREGIVAHGLQDKVKLKGAVDFETELVPFARAHADIYLSCHRQSDPSCTYIESMGCGLAVVGYANRMWSALCQKSSAGWIAPLGRPNALADAIADASNERQRLSAYCDSAHQFGAGNSFEREYRRRIEHLQART